MKTSLVVLAAGLGSRFGGDKQICHVGPSGEFLMEYSIYDAITAGFDRIILILKQEMIPVVKALCGGLGQNIFNPALSGRALLMIAFPVSITRYVVDGVSSATPRR